MPELEMTTLYDEKPIQSVYSDLTRRDEYERYCSGKVIPIPTDLTSYPRKKIALRSFVLILNPVAGAVIMTGDDTISRIYLHLYHPRYNELLDRLVDNAGRVFKNKIEFVCRYNKNGNLIQYIMETMNVL